MMRHPLDPAVVFASVAQTRIRRAGRRQTCEEETMGRLPNRHRVSSSLLPDRHDKTTAWMSGNGYAGKDPSPA